MGKGLDFGLQAWGVWAFGVRLRGFRVLGLSR